MAPRFAIVSYYLYTKNTGNFFYRYYRGIAYAPRPLWGQGWRKGGLSSLLKKDFYESYYFYTRFYLHPSYHTSLRALPGALGTLPLLWRSPQCDRTAYSCPEQ